MLGPDGVAVVALPSWRPPRAGGRLDGMTRQRMQGVVTRAALVIAACGMATVGMAACAAVRVARAQAPAAPPPPTLVVLVTADQFRADYLDRFAPQFTGGLRRLLAEGARYTDAHHDHAITETAPGHATLLSGRFPRSTGIMFNREGVEDPDAPLLANGYGPGASPRRFQGTTVADWLRDADRRSRLLSVSMKDRGAILPVGRARGDVYWYSPDGRFLTSRHYARTLPAWVDAFNDRHLPASFAGKRWELLLPAASYAEPDSVVEEIGGRGVAFPHPLGDDPVDAQDRLRITPFMDEVTLAFALHGVEALRLGAGPQTDLLSVSLSATDVIGHSYGPASREMHDQVVRLDRALGRFLDSLFVLRDPARVLLVFTADHGVAEIPELAAGIAPPPVRATLATLVPALRTRLRALGVDTLAVAVDAPIVLADRAAFRRAADLDSVMAAVAREARALPGVLRADPWSTIVADSAADPVARRWAHQFPAQSNVALVVTLHPGSTWGGNVASHGSPHPYDSHVPLLFWGAGIRPGVRPDAVRTVDIAPTLAALLGVRVPAPVDGRALPLR